MSSSKSNYSSDRSDDVQFRPAQDFKPAQDKDQEQAVGMNSSKSNYSSDKSDDVQFRPAQDNFRPAQDEDPDKDLFRPGPDQDTFRPAQEIRVKPTASEPEEVVVESARSMSARSYDRQSRQFRQAQSSGIFDPLQWMCSVRPKWIDAIDDFFGDGVPEAVTSPAKDPMFLPSETAEVISGCVTVDGYTQYDLHVLHDAVQATIEDLAHVADVAEVGSPQVFLTRQRPAGGTLLDLDTAVFKIAIQVPDITSAGRVYTTLKKVQDESVELLKALSLHCHEAGVAPPERAALALDAIDEEQFFPDSYYFHGDA